MKMVYEGHPDWWVDKEVRCDECRSVYLLEFEDDLSENTGKNLLGYSYRFVEVSCVICGNILQVYRHELIDQVPGMRSVVV